MPRPLHIRPRRGFTFLEISIVIVIMGTLLLVAAPSMMTLQKRNRLNTGAREIASMMRYARGQAIFSERTVEARFDFATQRYRLDLNDTLQEESRRFRREGRLRSTEEAIRHLPRGVVFSNVFAWDGQITPRGVLRVEFFPNGSATPTLIELQDGDGKVMAVEVNRSAGRVRIHQGKPENVSFLESQSDLLKREMVFEE